MTILDVAGVSRVMSCSPREAVKLITKVSGPSALSTTEEALFAWANAQTDTILVQRDTEELWPEDIARRLKCTRKQAIGVIAIAGRLERGDAAQKNPVSLGDLNAWLRSDLSARFVHPSQGTSRLHTYVYFISCRSSIKIGYTRNVEQRVSHIQMLSPTPVQAVALLIGGQQLESALHARFAEYHIHGEWFRNKGRLASLLQKAPGK